MTTHHPKFFIHAVLQLVGLTTEKLLPTALFTSALNKGINTDDAASVDINFVISSTGSSTTIIFLTSSS